MGYGQDDTTGGRREGRVMLRAGGKEKRKRSSNNIPILLSLEIYMPKKHPGIRLTELKRGSGSYKGVIMMGMQTQNESHVIVI